MLRPSNTEAWTGLPPFEFQGPLPAAPHPVFPLQSHRMGFRTVDLWGQAAWALTLGGGVHSLMPLPKIGTIGLGLAHLIWGEEGDMMSKGSSGKTEMRAKRTFLKVGT